MRKPAYRYDLFISYSGQDKSFVDFLVRCFENCGLTCYRDTIHLKIYEKLDLSLKEGIAHSRFLVAIISAAYLQSYWCMFEAIESIQGQDIGRRFLPIVVRHHPDDQTLDEEFVLKAVGALETEYSSFEHQMITAKAFALEPKLKKLHFVRSNLPLVYNKIKEDAYPQFDLWDEHSVRQNLQKLLTHLNPQARFDAQAVALDYAVVPQPTSAVPRLKDLPTLVWKTYIGRQARQNTPIAVGNDILVGSAGSQWNEPDAKDGIYCLDGNSGAVKWFSPAPADTNTVLYAKGLVLTGCDDGTALAVSARDGRRKWTRQLDGGIVGGPLKLPGDIGDAYTRPAAQPVPDPVLLVTAKGTLYLLDLHTGEQIGDTLELGTTVTTPPAFDATAKFQSNLFVATHAGGVAFITFDWIGTRLRLDRMVEVVVDGRWYGSGSPEFCSEPVYANGRLLLGTVAGTGHGPLVALDSREGTLLWWSLRPDGGRPDFGSVRTRPLVLGEQAVFTAAYSSELGIIDLETGVVASTIPLGREMFEHWSSPIGRGSTVFLGRHDGYLHKIDVERKSREWSIYIGNAEHAGVAVSGRQDVPEFKERAAWVAGGSQPILGTPLLDGDRLYASTYEGYLYCIANLG